MATQKVAISIDEHLVIELDNLVANKVFASRSQAIRIAVQEKIARMQRARLARECSKLDPAVERGLAEEGMSGELSQWPEY
jgi:metal-responsive CopG/Arc/MetJ family transcriptional regulator